MPSGIYIRTEEIKRKMSDCLKGNQRAKGHRHTGETKRKISENHGRCMLGKKHTEETKRKMSMIKLGKKHAEETKRKMGIKLKQRLTIKENHPMFNKKHSEETKKKMSESQKGHKVTKETKRKISIAHLGKNNPMHGKIFSEETKKKMSISQKQRFTIKENHPMYGKKHSEEFKIKVSNKLKGRISPMKGKYFSEETKKKISTNSKINWQNSNYRNKVVKATMFGNLIQPNKPELQLQSLLSNLYPNDWQYVGDGQVILGGFCPDFINVNGKKQIIEMNGDYWHNRQGAAEKDKRKIEAYKQLGYKTLTVWEHELKNTKKLENKIQEFCTC